MNTKLAGYELIVEKSVSDLNSKGYLFRHSKSGARIFILENDDTNKVFSIGFRTPPSDSTGVPHIMEHSVLCGSEKFPAKDPFVELVKGSLNTFLNAMTYPDKTVYPVASYNDQDFKNLMHVYMDAVFHPNIYERPQIFKQEGWHYELTDADEPVTINGVVYNEMKGAFSSPDDLVERKVFEALYPDTAYALESGGDPEVIPELTYEAFKAFHQKYYHPSNSFIYLYGDCDMEERLAWLDQEYLGKYEKIELDSSIKMQPAFEKVNEVRFAYPVSEDEELEDNTYLTYNCVIGDVLDRELYLAFQILDYALLSSPGAPVKERLLKSGLGRDVMSSYENGILQPYFSIMLKNSNEADKEKFVSLVRETLSELVENKIDRRTLEAGINYFEFKFREADFGAYPKGLMYGLQCYDSWLYDEENPFMHISATETINELKRRLDTDYFEQLIKKYLLDNNHMSIIVAVPERGLNEKKEKELADKLQAYKNGLSEDEIKALIADTAALKKYQEEPSTQEELESIPLLSVSDIKKEVEEVCNEEICEEGVEYLYHNVETNGIGYLTLQFKLDCVPHEYLPYVGLFKAFLGLLSTENYSYSELTNEINRNCGGITAGFSNYAQYDGATTYMPCFEIDAKMLSDKTDFVFAMLSEMLFTSKFEDGERFRELLMMLKSRTQMGLMTSGHSMAISRATSYYSDSAAFTSNLGGYNFYRFICELDENFDNKYQSALANISKALEYIFCQDKLMVDFTGSPEAFEKVKEKAAGFVKKLSDAHKPVVSCEFDHQQLNEGFKSASQVQYVAVSGNYKQAGFEYKGALKVLKVLMGYDYLWINVRVKGGAYGCMSSFKRNGEAALVSYRDPNLKETLDIYRNAAAYLEGFEASDRDMEKYIIGTISEMDIPLTPKMKGSRALGIYMTGIDMKLLQKERDEVLSCTKEDIRALSDYLKAIVDQGNICVVGGEQKIKDNADLFKNIENLL